MQAVNILLVEDNEADIELTTETMKLAKIDNSIQVARDGEEAMSVLRKQGDFEKSSTPDLILLDLNLPKKDGKQVLREIKEDEILKTIPVVVLTSSEAQEDVIKSYGLHCNAYVRKPIGLAGYHQIVQAVDNFWFKLVLLP